MRFLATLCLVFLSAVLHAGEVGFADVEQEGDVYRLRLRMKVQAEQQDILALLTDHDHLHRISDVLTDTARLPGTTEGKTRRRLVTKTCILFFCFQATVVEDVETLPGGRIFTTFIPAHSDFHYGRTEWSVEAVGDNQSEIAFRSEIQPGFWIPPVIGPFLLKHKMAREARTAILNIEKLTSRA